MSKPPKIIRKVLYKLYPTSLQIESLLGLLIHHHQLFNFCLKDRIQTYREFGYGLTYQDQSKINKQYRDRRKANRLFNANAQSEQVTLMRVDRAFKNFFDRLNKGQRGGFPRFKSFERYKGWGYATHGDGYKLHLNQKKHGAVYLSDVGIVKMRGKARNEGGVPKSAEVIRKNDQWYLSVSFEYESIERHAGTSALALDWGVEHYATWVNETGQSGTIDNPRFIQASRQRLTEHQRELALAKKGSRSWRYLKRRIAKVHETISNQRKHFIHLTTKRIVEQSGLLAMEELNIKGMTRSAKGTKEKPGKQVKQKAGLNRSVLDTAPSAFYGALAYKAAEAGTYVKLAPTRKLKPSQTCPSCSAKVKKTLSQRHHKCPCGYKAPRDLASAYVVLNWALGVNVLINLNHQTSEGLAELKNTKAWNRPVLAPS